ncbi:MAG: thioredoxin [Pleomorphochaeta sp.]|jgi:thioredoxin 1
MIRHTTSETFEKDVLQSDVPVLVDFWAAWCGPCRMQGSILEDFQNKISEKEARICKVNVDEHPALAQQFGVMSIPTLIVFENGKIKSQVAGVNQEPGLRRMLGL